MARLVNRIRARILYGPQLHARPLAAMALTALMILGGGAYLWRQQLGAARAALQGFRGSGRFADIGQQRATARSLENLTDQPDEPDDDMNAN